MAYTQCMDKKLMLTIVILIIVGLLAFSAYQQVSESTSRSEATQQFCVPGGAEECAADMPN